MNNNILAVFFAALAALIIAWGTVVRHNIAERAPADGTLQGSPVITAIKRPLWWFACGTAFAGYSFQVVALSYGSLLIVQPILALSLMFTMPMTAYYHKRPLYADEIGWAAVLTIAVAVLVILGNPEPGDPRPVAWVWALALSLGIIVSLTIDRATRHAPRNIRGLFLGVIVGIIYGFIAVLSKATVDVYQHEGSSGLLTHWVFWFLILGSIIGTIVQQYAFNTGALKLSLPAMTTVEPIIAFILSYVILGEQFHVHGFNWIIMALALIAMVTSTFALSARGNT
ncbi:DMT family transporter [Corynebacterium sp. ES2794-CONJ1]|uniref:DMT family transporter n=1 Tax=unclassified Corynebacterium TaxID=2624378 RepID=UPI002167E1EF|nr:MULTISPECIES: DMT family transporter [unclassified Corynebacterium]MCS4492124.1 DMT family transporter [Corynebacterium sp. ES2715-CONJ3]MCS4532392.1 DMT family transporter [Corynebacterium sp. ES2730-CONJ]MCU9519645.1 DMT family transporter [Corynebacterium sp. ES2794-CONJ1]